MDRGVYVFLLIRRISAGETLFHSRPPLIVRRNGLQSRVSNVEKKEEAFAYRSLKNTVGLFSVSISNSMQRISLSLSLFGVRVCLCVWSIRGKVDVAACQWSKCFTRYLSLRAGRRCWPLGEEAQK